MAADAIEFVDHPFTTDLGRPIRILAGDVPEWYRVGDKAEHERHDRFARLRLIAAPADFVFFRRLALVQPWPRELELR